MLQGTKGAYKNTCISKLSQKEIKKAVPSVIASKRTKYFGINKKKGTKIAQWKPQNTDGTK